MINNYNYILITVHVHWHKSSGILTVQNNLHLAMWS